MEGRRGHSQPSVTRLPWDRLPSADHCGAWGPAGLPGEATDLQRFAVTDFPQLPSPPSCPGHGHRLLMSSSLQMSQSSLHKREHPA